MRTADLFKQHAALGRAEVGFAVFREDFRDRHALALLDALVDVHRLPVQTPRERSGHGRLAGGHESDQVHFFSFQALRLAQSSPIPSRGATSRSSVSKKPGYEMTTASAPEMVEERSAPSAAIANAIAMR